MTVCKEEPRQDSQLRVTANSRQMHRWLLGRTPFRAVLDAGDAEVHGPAALVRGFPTWFDTSIWAAGLERGSRRAVARPAGPGDCADPDRSADPDSTRAPDRTSAAVVSTATR